MAGGAPFASRRTWAAIGQGVAGRLRSTRDRAGRQGQAPRGQGSYRTTRRGAPGYGPRASAPRRGELPIVMEDRQGLDTFRQGGDPGFLPRCCSRPSRPWGESRLLADCWAGLYLCYRRCRKGLGHWLSAARPPRHAAGRGGATTPSISRKAQGLGARIRTRFHLVGRRSWGPIALSALRGTPARSVRGAARALNHRGVWA